MGDRRSAVLKHRELVHGDRDAADNKRFVESIRKEYKVTPVSTPRRPTLRLWIKRR